LLPPEFSEARAAKIKNKSQKYHGITVFRRSGTFSPFLLTKFYPNMIDEHAKSPENDGFVKSSPAAGGTRRAKTESEAH
jgi:hypothetical protein